MVTISQVADHAGVSPATVSRVLNGDERVGEEYKQRVHDAVAALGYRPNRLARSLRTQRRSAIGVVVSDIENPHFSEMVRAVEDLAYGAGHHLLVCNTDESPEKQRTYLEMLADEHVLGVILSPSHPAGEEIGLLIDRGIPVVAFDREVADTRADVVIADNVRGARTATELLLRAGHEDVVFVGGRADVETGAERLDGYALTMRRAGREPRVVEADFRIEGARAVTTELLASDRPPTALVVANNLMTVGVLAAMRERGLRAPDDLALVGIDDPFWAPYLDPPLTVVAQPVRKMAADAMELLHDRVSGRRSEPRRIVHPFELRRRVSCGTAGPPTQ